MKFIIEASSKKGDLVLDCFCGSGTTLLAAQSLGRHWIGIDKSPSAIKVTKNRLNDLPSDLFSIVEYEFLVEKQEASETPKRIQYLYNTRTVPILGTVKNADMKYILKCPKKSYG